MSVVGERIAVATVASRIRQRARQSPEAVALREKRFGIWQEVTWRNYWEQVELAAHGLAALGVSVGDRVAIHSENRPEWLYADLATVALRAMTVGLYPTNPPAEVAYLAWAMQPWPLRPISGRCFGHRIWLLSIPSPFLTLPLREFFCRSRC